MSLVPGSRLGPYEVVALIGSGGMGEVYRARDRKLQRDVALKVLPDHFASDAERLARFQREAQVLASLNHPNIAAIYGLEEGDPSTGPVLGDVRASTGSARTESKGSGQAPSTGSGQGVRALVLEFVEGPTLADRIADGPLPIDETLPIARQIAAALEAAHEHNIIHRDLKPANVKVRPDGTVKVLDFGLAKLVPPEPPSAAARELSHLPTLTSPAAASRMGVIMGTAAYMSPEQARGKPVDKRADIWAFGCVLYEMLTGKRPFEGEDVSETLAHVIDREPAFGAVPPKTPAAIRRVLRRCLQKNPRERIQDIGDVRIQLDDARSIDSDTADAHRGAARAAWWRSARAATVFGAGLLIVGALLGGFLDRQLMPSARTGTQVVRTLVGVEPADQVLGAQPDEIIVGFDRPSRTALVLSPDGRVLVFSGRQGTRQQLYVRAVDQLEAAPLPGTEGGEGPFFSPDGRWVGFWASGELKKVSLVGGPPVAICKVGQVFGASWGVSDAIVFAREFGGLWTVSAAGGTPEVLTKVDPATEFAHRLPQVLPAGNAVLYTVQKVRYRWDNAQVVVQSLPTGVRKTLVEDATDARYVASGHLVFARQGALMAVPFDLERLAVTGGAAGVLAGIMHSVGSTNPAVDTGAAHFSVTDSGTLAYLAGTVYPAREFTLEWADRAGRAQVLRIPPGNYFTPRLSPDGRRAALTLGAPGNFDLALVDLTRSTLTRLTTGDGYESYPVWTPDGSRITFAAGTAGSPNLFWQPADAAQADRLTESDDVQMPIVWSPDGRVLAFVRRAPDRQDWDIWLLPTEEGRKPYPLVETPATEWQPDFSPDGRWIAYTSNESGRAEVYVQPYPGSGGRYHVSTEGGVEPAWAPNGRELFYQVRSPDPSVPTKMMAVDVTTTPAFSAGSPRELFEGWYRRHLYGKGYDVTPDGQRFLMLEGKDPPAAPVTHIVLVLNWFAELRRLVPGN